MSLDHIVNAPVWQQVYEVLKGEIVSGRWCVGAKLPSMRELAQKVGTSHYPVQKAVGELQREGYVEKRHGSGTYVIDTSAPAVLSESVAVCMDAQGHVWGDLLSMLAGRLQGSSTSLSVVDSRHDNYESALTNLARSGVRQFVVRGNRHFRFGVFMQPLFQDATVLGLVHWSGPELPGLVQVLTDEEAGGRMLARHVRERGHRMIILCAFDPRDFVGPAEGDERESPPLHGRHGRVFLREWEKLGGEWAVIRSIVHEDSSVEVDPDAVLAPFRNGKNPPTAIVGLRDVDALRARQALACRVSDVARGMEVFGYFNTPWSRASDRPFTSVDLDLDEIADRAAAVLQQNLSGKEISRSVQLVEPRLVIRPSRAPDVAPDV
jgi:DNA-binding LacI/PurR family transcriptional regulator/DNA-binding transcriptional regulator YhcF (GntR family)